MNPLKKSLFYQQAQTIIYPLSFFGEIAKKKYKIIEAIFFSKTVNQDLNILLYGDLSVEKHYAYSLANSLKREVYYLKQPDIGEFTLEYFHEQLTHLSTYLDPEKSIILVEETAKWIDDPHFKLFLTQNRNIITFWLMTTKVDVLPRKISSLFDYSLFLAPLTHQQRFELLSNAIKKVELDEYFTVPKIYKLAEDESHTIDAIENFIQDIQEKK